jgi:hypothetical protein
MVVLAINGGIGEIKVVCIEIKTYVIKIIGLEEKMRRSGGVERERIGMSCGCCGVIKT